MPTTTQSTTDLAVRAESLYEELGGDLCICQRVDVPQWCEKCQSRIAYILSVFKLLLAEGSAAGIEAAIALVKGAK